MWKDVPEKIFGAPLKGGSISAEISPELLGVGYIIGPRIGSIMMAGGVLSCLVLTPLIKFFGEGLNVMVPPGRKPIAEMTRATSAAPISFTSGRGRWLRAASSAWCGRCPSSGRASASGLSDFRAAAVAQAAVLRTERTSR